MNRSLTGSEIDPDTEVYDAISHGYTSLRSLPSEGDWLVNARPAPTPTNHAARGQETQSSMTFLTPKWLKMSAICLKLKPESLRDAALVRSEESS